MMIENSPRASSVNEVASTTLTESLSGLTVSMLNRDGSNHGSSGS